MWLPLSNQLFGYLGRLHPVACEPSLLSSIGCPHLPFPCICPQIFKGILPTLQLDPCLSPRNSYLCFQHFDHSMLPSGLSPSSCRIDLGNEPPILCSHCGVALTNLLIPFPHSSDLSPIPIQAFCYRRLTLHLPNQLPPTWA